MFNTYTVTFPLNSPGPGWGGFIQYEESGVVVAMEELDVLHTAHPLTQVSQRHSVAGLDVVVLTVPGRGGHGGITFRTFSNNLGGNTD